MVFDYLSAILLAITSRQVYVCECAWRELGSMLFPLLFNTELECGFTFSWNPLDLDTRRFEPKVEHMQTEKLFCAGDVIVSVITKIE